MSEHPVGRETEEAGGRGRRDRLLIYASAFIRAVATGLSGVLIGAYMAKEGFSAEQAGYVVGAGLGGGALAALVATFYCDAHGRRRVLVELASLGVLGALVMAARSELPLLVAAAFVGMLNGMGKDRGAALIVEHAIMPSVVESRRRTPAFAAYNVLQAVGYAFGSLLAGLPTWLEGVGGLSGTAPHRVTFGLYATLMVSVVAVYRVMSPGVEVTEREGSRPKPLTPRTRRIVLRISALFTVDSLATGLLTTSLLSYFFFERFEANEASVGALFFVARLANALSHFGAAWLAARFGLIPTMAFTHLPSSLFLVAVAFAPTFAIAAALFVLRECLVEMDVPTRQSYIVAVVDPHERTRATGVTNLVRLAAWAVAPTFAGVIMDRVSLVTPLLLGAGIKIVYDLLLYVSFRGVRPPEERA